MEKKRVKGVKKRMERRKVGMEKTDENEIIQKKSIKKVEDL